MASLHASSDRFGQLAGLLGNGRAGWTGCGLEYLLYPSGQRCLGGLPGNDQVSFLAELRPPGFYPRAPGPGWEVDAEVAVRCEADLDCGMHTVESFERTNLSTAAEAVAAASTRRHDGCLIARRQSNPPTGAAVIPVADTPDRAAAGDPAPAQRMGPVMQRTDLAVGRPWPAAHTIPA
jgi:hypothetical protein